MLRLLGRRRQAGHNRDSKSTQTWTKLSDKSQRGSDRNHAVRLSIDKMIIQPDEQGLDAQSLQVSELCQVLAVTRRIMVSVPDSLKRAGIVSGGALLCRARELACASSPPLERGW